MVEVERGDRWKIRMQVRTGMDGVGAISDEMVAEYGFFWCVKWNVISGEIGLDIFCCFQTIEKM